jgi:hypothetical protein
MAFGKVDASMLVDDDRTARSIKSLLSPQRSAALQAVTMLLHLLLLTSSSLTLLSCLLCNTQDKLNDSASHSIAVACAERHLVLIYDI